MTETDPAKTRTGAKRQENYITPAPRIAITWASGYVGRLLAYLLAGSGHQVVALARDSGTLPTGERITAVVLDVADPVATVRALAGAEAPYYLVHAMAEGTGFEARDREFAATFGRAGGVGRIIYLGRLGGGNLSAHLISRRGVGEVLAPSAVPVVERRAAITLGAGSVSYEMLRSLTERLPVMVCPRRGDGWLTFRITDAPPRLEQAVAAFGPKGLLGLTYWWALWPVHQVAFRVIVQSRARRQTAPLALMIQNANRVGPTTTA